MDACIAILRLYPGISAQVVSIAVLDSSIKVVICLFIG